MLVMRTYRCDACGTEYESLVDRDAPIEPCKLCSAEEVAHVPPNRLAIGGSTVVKAADYAQEMVAKQYGLTDLRTNLRDGDTAVLPPQMKTSEGKAMLASLDKQGPTWGAAGSIMADAAKISKADKAPVMDSLLRMKQTPLPVSQRIYAGPPKK